jgi:hypothetical protein
VTALNRCLATAALFLFVATALCQMTGRTNLPYTATKKETYFQKLADGTTITRVNTITEARDSQGKTMQTNSPVIRGPGVKITMTTVTDPAAHTRTVWITPGREANRTYMPDPAAMRASRGQTTAMGSGSGVVFEASGAVVAASVSPTPTLATANIGIPNLNPADPNLKPQMHSEKLPGKAINGIYVEGTRMTITYPVGSVGNDRPIVSVHETWTSPDLRIVVLSTDEDPRSGTHTSEITNLDRSEPDPAIFQVPEGYVVNEHHLGSN